MSCYRVFCVNRNDCAVSRLAKVLALVVLVVGVGQAPAAEVMMDFNDAMIGNLSGQTGLGSGTSGTWVGSGLIDVLNGDLTAPAGTNHAVTQGGNARSVKHGGTNNTVARKSTVDLDTALTGSTIWGSFLVNQNGQSGGRGGIALNQGDRSAGAGPSNPRLFVIADDFEAWLASSAEIKVADTSNDGFDNTILVLFRVDFDPVGDETTSVWIDPDVTSPGAPDGTSTSDWLDASGITSLTVFSYTNTGTNTPTGGPIVDSIRLSDLSDGYQHVTGVPEPAGVILLGVGLVLFVRPGRKA